MAIDRLQLTSSLPCWMTINKRILISFIVPVIQHGRQCLCHLNLSGMVANHQLPMTSINIKDAKKFGGFSFFLIAAGESKCLCNDVIWAAVVGVLVLIIICLILYIVWLHKKGKTVLYFRVHIFSSPPLCYITTSLLSPL